MQYKYFYTKRTAAKIRSFYRNVAKNYQHTYSYEDMERNVRDAFFALSAASGANWKTGTSLSAASGATMR